MENKQQEREQRDPVDGMTLDEAFEMYREMHGAKDPKLETSSSTASTGEKE